jgi:hypothetical protein
MNDLATETSAAAAAKQLDVDWSAERGAHSLARVHARRARRSALYRVSGAVAALAVAIVVWWGGTARKPPAPSAPTVAAASPSSLAVPLASQSPKTTFVDGSVARVSDGGELVVNVATPEHIESVLTTGAADFEVTKHPERDFVVVAGPVRVRVVGTHFRVERSGERTRVAVSEGKVEVRVGDAVSYLEAGESRFFPSQPEGALSSEPRAPSVEDLMQAADAARSAGHPEQAVGYLRRVTGEHPADSRAPLAAFTLGRVLASQLGRPSEAADAFALSRKLKPSGALAEDALAREAEARAAAGATAQARALAEQYLSRYPQGKHAPSLQALVTAK